MNGFEAYKLYLALKQHFTSDSYDFFKYNGKMNVRKDTYEKKNDKIFFDKLGKHPDLLNFLVANLYENQKIYIRELAYSKTAEDTYNNWNKRQGSLSYTIQNDLRKTEETLNELLICKDNSHPKILLYYMSNTICIETVCLLLEFCKTYNYLDKELREDILWKEYRKKFIKYSPFIKADKDKVRKIFVDFYRN